MTENRPQHKVFAKNYLDTGNGTESVKAAYPEIKDDNYAAVKATRLLRNDKVRELLEDNAEKVASNMVTLALGAEKESDQISAGKDVLDRAGYKPVEKSQSINVDVKVDATDPKAKALALEYEEKLRLSML